jgi:general secretion pathway protein D
LDVNVTGISDLFAFQFDIGFNPAVLSATSVTEGAVFSSAGVSFFPGFIDNVGGTITFVGDSLSGSGPGLSTDGTLATVLFNSIGPGSSSLTLANIVLLDSGLGDITASVSGASVDVTGGGAAVPEPGTFVLLGLVLVACGCRVERRER